VAGNEGRPAAAPAATTETTTGTEAAGAPGAADQPFYELFARNPLAMYVVDLDTLRFIAVNDAMVRQYGYDRDELLTMDLTQIRPPEDVAAIRAKAASVPQGFDDAGIWRHRTKAGSTILVQVTSHGLTFAGRRARLVVVHDVTEERRIAEELRRSRDELAVILHGIDDGVSVQDPLGRLVYVNDAAARTMGYPTAEVLLATPIAEVMRVFELLDEAGNPFPLAELPGRRALQGEHPPRVTLRWRRRDIGDERWSVVGAAPVFDDDGRVRLAVNTFHDVTERKRAEDALRFLAEAGEVLATSLDPATTLANLARLAVPSLADWCAVDLIGDDGAVRRLAVEHVDPAKVALAKAIAERYPADPKSPRGVYRVLETGEPDLYPQIDDALLVAVARDEEHLALLRSVGLRSAIIVPLVGREQILGALSLVSAESGRRYGPDDQALAVDLARRAALAVDNARLYQAAQAAILARDEFLSVAAHELRTPIVAMKGYAQLLRRTGTVGSRDPEWVERALRRIEGSAGRLAALVDDLLIGATDRLGGPPIRPRPVDLAALVREVVAAAEDRIDARHRLSVAGAEVPQLVTADPERIEQVLTNLLDNAIKYSPAGGEIRVALRQEGEGVLLTVTDSGIGLPPGAAEAIFEPFGRTGPALDLSVPGFGLGLSISRRIVELHGGRIWAESAGEGAGATFAVWLPREGPAAGAATASPDRD
jgi:PAS domain S-box-containing protein